MEEKTFFNGNWKAVEKIGEGTFGIVYKAEKVKNYGIKTYSAIKQILIPHSEKEYKLQKSEGMTQSDIEKSYDNQVKKWISEIEFLNQFKGNANIVEIEDFEVLERIDKLGRIINIRMELLHSIEDNELNKIMTDKKVLKMALDILNALEECEEKNVVHRDIKPDNVFVNGRGVFKLGDFGEAKNIEKTVSNMSKRGTENYMAPEIYKGERGSKTVDIYSLGIMLYKYFNNNRIPFLPDYPTPITYEDRENALYKRMSGEEMKAPVKASSNMAKIILKACSYSPKDRYKSATELRKDIEREYKAIETPINLFDFQQEEKESPQQKTAKEPEPIIIEYFPDNLKEKSSYDETVSIFKDFLPKDKKDDSSSKTHEVHPDSEVKEPDKNIVHDKANDKHESVNDKKEEPVKQSRNDTQDDNAKKILNETVNDKNEKSNNNFEDKKSSNDKTDKEIKNDTTNSKEDSFNGFEDVNLEELMNQMFNNKKERPKQQSDYQKAQEDKKIAKQKAREAKQELEHKKKAELRAKNKFLFFIYSFLEMICGLLFWIIIGLGIFDIFNGLFAGLILTFGLFIALALIWHPIKVFLEWLINVFDQTKKK